jgi:hypothetical protein
MKMGHTFMPQHGFTGSAGNNMRPSIPGYKHGGMEMGEHESHGDHPKHDHVGYDKHGYETMKHGGRAHHKK